MAADIPEPSSGGKGKRPRVGVRLDMTPMVDVAFLLLTFFMLTSVFSRPQAMEVNLPESDEPIELPESNVMTIRIDAEGVPFWNIATNDPEESTMDDLHDVLTEQLRLNPELVTIIKVHRDANYATGVNILDELELANVTRFSIAPMTDDDLAVLTEAGGTAPPPTNVRPPPGGSVQDPSAAPAAPAAP